MMASILLLVTLLFAKNDAFQFAGWPLLSSSSGGETAPLPVLPPVDAAVIVPGFLTGQDDFKSLAQSLTRRGIPTAVVPMPVWHWIPCIGGRSIRPILERVDYTVRYVSACYDNNNSNDAPSVPPFEYSIGDCIYDFFHNPGGVQKVGGSDIVEEYPLDIEPRGTFPSPPSDPKVRIALIGHSAGGFISRAYLSNRAYGGKAYCGIQFVHSLVTLGTPHANGNGPAFETVKWCNQEDPSFLSQNQVRVLVLGASGSPGDSSGSLTEGAYAFCSPTGDGYNCDGDGLTTLESSLALDGDTVEKKVLPGVTHYPWSDAGIWGDIVAPDLAKEHREGKPWYGDDAIVEEWADFLVSS